MTYFIECQNKEWRGVDALGSAAVVGYRLYVFAAKVTGLEQGREGGKVVEGRHSIRRVNTEIEEMTGCLESRH